MLYNGSQIKCNTIHEPNNPPAGTDINGWANHPYNTNTTDQTPDNFFTESNNWTFFENRLRYIHARWGYSTAVMCYSIFNELDLVNDPLPPYEDCQCDWNCSPDIKKPWVANMANYLKNEVGWPRHLVTLDHGWGFSDEGNANLDFVNYHVYTGDKLAEVQRNMSIRQQVAKYGKPCIVTEYSPQTCNNNADANDCASTFIHHGIWASVFSGSFATSFYFGTDSKYHNNGYGDGGRLYLPLSNFLGLGELGGINFGSGYTSIGNQKSMYDRAVLLFGSSNYDARTAAPPPFSQTFDEDGFVREDDFPDPLDINLLPKGITASNNELIEIYALGSSNHIFGWVRHRNFYWYNYNHEPWTHISCNVLAASDNCDIDNHCTTTHPLSICNGNDSHTSIVGSTMTIELDDIGGCGGVYLVEWYNTWPCDDNGALAFSNGQLPCKEGLLPEHTEEVTSFNGKLTVTIPTLENYNNTNGIFHAPDYAFTISLVDRSGNYDNATWDHHIVEDSDGVKWGIKGNLAVVDSEEKVIYLGCGGERMHQVVEAAPNANVWVHSHVSPTTNSDELLLYNCDIAVDQSNKSIYYKNKDNNSDGFVYQYWLNGTNYSSASLSSTFGNTQRIVANPEINGNNQVGTLAVNSSSGSVFYRNVFDRVREYRWNSTGGNWMTLAVDAGGSTITKVCGDIAIHDQSKNIFYIGCDGYIHLYWWNPSISTQNKWVHENLSNIAAISTRGNIAVDQSNGSVYFRSNTDEFVHQYWWDVSNNTWQHTYLTSTFNAEEQMLDGGDIAVDYSTGSVYYEGEDNFIHQYWWNGQYWEHNSLNKNNSTPDDEEKVDGDIAVNSLSGRVYFKGTYTGESCSSSNIHYYSLNSENCASGIQGYNNDRKMDDINRQKHSLTNKLICIPNPFNDRISIYYTPNTEEINHKYSIVFRNILGDIALQKNFYQTGPLEYTLDTQILTPGAYVIALIQDDMPQATIKCILVRP